MGARALFAVGAHAHEAHLARHAEQRGRGPGDGAESQLLGERHPAPGARVSAARRPVARVGGERGEGARLPLRLLEAVQQHGVEGHPRHAVAQLPEDTRADAGVEPAHQPLLREDLARAVEAPLVLPLRAALRVDLHLHARHLRAHGAVRSARRGERGGGPFGGPLVGLLGCLTSSGCTHSVAPTPAQPANAKRVIVDDSGIAARRWQLGSDDELRR